MVAKICEVGRKSRQEVGRNYLLNCYRTRSIFGAMFMTQCDTNTKLTHRYVGIKNPEFFYSPEFVE